MTEINDYLTSENARNKAHAALYEQIRVTRFASSRIALCSLLFDHDIMVRLFGERAVAVMQALARVPWRQR